jgi:tetratricopeptide (TPR) repeat protein
MTAESDLSHLQSEFLKRGYSLEEVEHIYALGRLYLESGNLRQASLIFDGLVDVVPHFTPALLARAIIALFQREYTDAADAAKRAFTADPHSVEALLLLVLSLFGLNDYNSAGTYLGEVRDAIESGNLTDKQLLRVYRMLLARYRSRL